MPIYLGLASMPQHCFEQLTASSIDGWGFFRIQKNPRAAPEWEHGSGILILRFQKS
jgi:hypothetical protein